MLFVHRMGLAEWVSSALDAFRRFAVAGNGDSEGFVEQSGVNVSFREREREKPCLRV